MLANKTIEQLLLKLALFKRQMLFSTNQSTYTINGSGERGKGLGPSKQAVMFSKMQSLLKISRKRTKKKSSKITAFSKNFNQQFMRFSPMHLHCSYFGLDLIENSYVKKINLRIDLKNKIHDKNL